LPCETTTVRAFSAPTRGARRGGRWLPTKTEFNEIGGLRTYIRIVPICGTFQKLQTGLSFPPELGPILLANEGQSGAVVLGRQGMKEAAN
jgi:hypothetical protein